MENNILLYNNALNLNLKQAMNDANDVLYNIQSLKQFQWNLDQIQKMKDGAQMQVNMAALALWRNFILDEGNVGIILFQNLVRKYYCLNDNGIIKYETFREWINNKKKWFYITNLDVIKRKGECFLIEGVSMPYCIDNDSRRIRNAKDIPELMDIFYDAMAFSDISMWPAYVYRHSCYIDFLKEVEHPEFIYVAQNKFTIWSWDLVSLLKKCHVKDLLQNDGFFAQMGINNIRETLNHLQEIVGNSFEITKDMKNEVVARLEQKGIALYSYLPISKEFILQHQNELDWKVMQKNPRIQWDWELINLYLRKVKDTVSEDKWREYLLGSKAMYTAVENYLNDDILTDIEKLYDIV